MTHLVSHAEDWGVQVAMPSAAIADRLASEYQALLQYAQNSEPSHALCIGLAQAAMAAQDLAAAEAWWSRSLIVEPENAEFHCALGAARYRQGKTKLAIASYRRAFDLAPEKFGVRVSLAIACLDAGLPSLALSFTGDCSPGRPEEVDLRLVRASAQIKLGGVEEAVADLDWLFRNGAKLAEVALLEVDVNLARGEFEVALMLAAEVCESYPNHIVPLQKFRKSFSTFLRTVPKARVTEFVQGMGLALPVIRPPTASADLISPPIDVIIPVHNGLDHLMACLDSIERHRTPLLGKIILVDDCSDPETRDWMRKCLCDRRNLRLVATPVQSGFSHALALGISQSRSKRFVALNSDCIIGAGWLEKLNRAMPEGGRVAMVGPLSNSAGWQNLGDIFDARGNYCKNSTLAEQDIAYTERTLDLIKVFAAPATVLIHGFCVLVDRASYDDLGGVDKDLFPKGYGEFQDLSIRALDGGYELRIADDCFVQHARGGSISNAQRGTLSQQARKALYQRYTALRYLTAECLAVENKQINFTRRRFAALQRYGQQHPISLDFPARLSVFGEDTLNFEGRRVCLFVSFSPDGRLLPYTRHYLSALRENGLDVVLILNVEGAHSVTDEAMALANVVILRDNIGFDFGAWRDVMARFPVLWQARQVLFANDSLIGPFGQFDKVMTRIADTPAPLFYLTESDFEETHFQSFFWGLQGAGLRNPVVRAFLSSIRNLTDKRDAIFMYEVFFRHVCENLADLSSECLFPLDSLTGVQAEIRSTFNPTHHLWRELLRAGFPFLKSDLCRNSANGPAGESWMKEMRAQGGDDSMARLHVEEALIQRAPR